MYICHAITERMLGDFNANVKTRANFAVLLEEFYEQFSYVWSRVIHIPMLVMLGVVSHG